MYLCYFRKLTSNNCAVCFGYKRKSATVLPGVSRYKDMKQFNIKFWIIILLSAAESTAESTAESIGRCNESIPTVDYVASCPKTETEWINASQRKSCESLAELQTCTQAQKFKYHCVFNSWKNATLEVCAPEIISQGFCVNFNEAAAQLQLFYNEPCTEFLVPCKTRFKSSNLSEYILCNEKITIPRHFPPNSTFDELPYELLEMDSPNRAILDISITTCVFVAILLVVTVLKNLLRCYNRKEKQDFGACCFTFGQGEKTLLNSLGKQPIYKQKHTHIKHIIHTNIHGTPILL